MPLSSHTWIALFAARLLQLRLGMGKGYAVRCAVANYHHAAELDPRASAEAFARAEGASAANDADPGLRYVAPASTRYRDTFGWR